MKTKTVDSETAQGLLCGRVSSELIQRLVLRGERAEAPQMTLNVNSKGRGGLLGIKAGPSAGMSQGV